jgi:beta-catenin-like protein 1
MTSVDDLFRKPSASSSGPTGSKRKLPETPSHPPSTFYKSPKLTTNGTPHTPTVEDDEDDVLAGPALPPDPNNDEEEAGDEDEEGRFFGSGVSADTKDALDYVEGVDGGEEESVVDGVWLRRTAVGFERRINKNAEMRAKWEGEAEKYVH